MEKLLNEIATHFQINPKDITFKKIRHGKREKQNVCRLKIRKEDYLLKQHEVTDPVTESGFSPFQIEKFTLSTLYKNRCLVPQVVWDSEQYHALLLTWCGDQTLDSLAQSESVSSIMPVLHAILIELCKLETFFADNIAQFKPYVFHFELKQTLQHLLEQGRKTIGYLEHLGNAPLTVSQKAQLDDAWNSLSNRLLAAQRTLGGLDYQANNIVIDVELPYFIDFSSVGWDWQERRLVQFFNSIGANQENANFVCMLNRELVEKYATWVVQHREEGSLTDVAARVDGHNLLFYLSIIHKLLAAVAKPEIPENRILLDAWGDARLRFERAITLIINSNLSDDHSTTQIRKMIAEFYAGIA